MHTLVTDAAHDYKKIKDNLEQELVDVKEMTKDCVSHGSTT